MYKKTIYKAFINLQTVYNQSFAQLKPCNRNLRGSLKFEQSLPARAARQTAKAILYENVFKALKTPATLRSEVYILHTNTSSVSKLLAMNKLSFAPNCMYTYVLLKLFCRLLASGKPLCTFLLLLISSVV